MTFRLDGRKVARSLALPAESARAIAVSYAAAGADVAISARDEAKLAEAAAEIEAHGRKAVIVPADVLDGDADAQPSRRSRVGARWHRHLGQQRRWKLVLNADGKHAFLGLAGDLQPQRGIDCSCLSGRLPHLQAANSASVINVSSVCVTCRNAVHVSLRRCGRRRRVFF